jgi:hypothetical protein
VADDDLQRTVDVVGDRQRHVGHRFDGPEPREGDLCLLRDEGDREDLGDRLQRLRIIDPERFRLSRDEIDCSDCPPL